MEQITAFFAEYGELFWQGTIDTAIMTCVSCIFAYVIGLPVGVWFNATTPNGIKPNAVVNFILGWAINILRAMPFVILMVAIQPFTRLVVGTSLGVAAACVPLTITAAPFVARIVEQSLAEVDAGIVEATRSFGASNWQIIKVQLRESLPSLIRGGAITFVTLFGFVAMAGTIGAGGLRDIAIRYGYNRYMPDVMVFAIILCIVFIVVFQLLGDTLSAKLDHRKTLGGGKKHKRKAQPSTLPVVK